MRILHLLCFPLWGSGSGTYTRKLAEKTAARDGYEVAIMAPETRRVSGVKIYPVKLPFKATITGHPEWPNAKRYSELTASEIDAILQPFLFKTIEAVRDFKPDVIHVQHAFFLTWIANYLKATRGINFIVTEHGTGVLNSSLDRRWLPLTKDALNRADAIVCVSGDTKKWFLKVYGRRFTRKTRVITGGVDHEGFARILDTTKLDKKYQLNGKRVVIFAGKLTKPKGVEYLVKAASKIKAEIFILGAGEELERLQQLARERGAKNVHFTGYLGDGAGEELKQFYQRADVSVVPSIWDEPLGLVVLEAMASGTPVVASHKGGIPLAVKDGVNGFLVRARSARAITEGVNKLLRDNALRAQFSTEARKIVENKFAWGVIAQKISELYELAYANSQKNQKMGRKLPYIDIVREQQEIRGRKIDYR